MLSEIRNLPAPAKLNLFLHVTGRRDDGYHLLETVFQFVDLSDTIDLRLREDGQIRRLGPVDDIAPQVDLTLKEFSVLRFLMTRPDHVVSAEQILEHVWDENADPFS